MKAKRQVRVLPILFQGSMIRGILNEIEKPGSGKTQTRRTLSRRTSASCAAASMNRS